MGPSIGSPRPDSEDTRQLLDQAAAGDPTAAGELLARHRDALRAFVALHLDPRVRTRVDPSDIVQEALADIAGRLGDYLERRPMAFHLWARRTAYERLLNAHRNNHAARRNVAREATGADPSSVALARSLLVAGPSPSEVVAARELADRVAAAIEALDASDREILLMRHAEELPYDEIGVLLGIEPATARKRYGRALIRLQQILAERGILGDV